MSFDVQGSRRIQTGDSVVRVALSSGASNLPASGVSRLIPTSIPSSQRYFWTDAWQAGERESAQARANGEVESFEDAGSLVRWLLTPEDND